jgi:hypothetical protein
MTSLGSYAFTTEESTFGGETSSSAFQLSSKSNPKNFEDEFF